MLLIVSTITVACAGFFRGWSFDTGTVSFATCGCTGLDRSGSETVAGTPAVGCFACAGA